MKYYCIELRYLIAVPVLCLFVGGFLGSFFQDHTTQMKYEGALKKLEEISTEYVYTIRMINKLPTSCKKYL